MRKVVGWGGSFAAIALVLTTASSAAAASPGVLLGRHDAGQSVPSNGIPIQLGNLSIPAGTWWVTATATLTMSSGGFGTGETNCEAASPTEADDGYWKMTDTGDGRSVAAVFLTFVHASASAWHAILRCTNNGPAGITATNVRISALSGSLTASGGPRLKRTAHAATISVAAGTTQTVASLSLTAGRWWIVGKADIENTDTNTDNASCKLALSTADTDQTKVSEYYSGQQGTEDEVAVQVGHSFGSAGTAHLVCGANRDVDVSNIQLIALKAGSLSQKDLWSGSTATGGSGTPSVVDGYYEQIKSSRWLSIANSGTYTTVKSISVPKGKWFLSAKLNVIDAQEYLVDCELVAGTAKSVGSTLGGPTGFGPDYLQTAVSATFTTKVSLKCRASGSGAKAAFIRITAVSAKSISSSQI